MVSGMIGSVRAPNRGWRTWLDTESQPGSFWRHGWGHIGDQKSILAKKVGQIMSDQFSWQMFPRPGASFLAYREILAAPHKIIWTSGVSGVSSVSGVSVASSVSGVSAVSIDALIDPSIHRWMDRWIDRLLNGSLVRWIDRWIDRWIGRWMDGWTDGSIDG